MKRFGELVKGDLIFDASGIENPRDYMWEEVNGIYYPKEKKETERKFIMISKGGRSIPGKISIDPIFISDKDIEEWRDGDEDPTDEEIIEEILNDEADGMEQNFYNVLIFTEGEFNFIKNFPL